MNASYDWLRAFVAIDATPTQLGAFLTAHTATVDELVPLRADLAPIVVARVVQAEPHPDSNHLWFTKVDAGGPELLEVICGAPNVKAGKLYPFAPVGTTLPNGVTIERRKIRSVVSNGMLCSAKELLLGDNHEGILELTLDAAPGTRLLSVMPVGDTRLVIDPGANRPDLLSHLGLARELTAITGTAWHLPDIPNLGPPVPPPRRVQGGGATAGVDVRVDNDTNARRYMAAVIRGVQVAPSPEWLVRRLDAVGVRSINNVVDATNYVLHELGQPIHAFDAAQLTDRVIVRRARPKEQLVTLDGVTRLLPANTVVIADGERARAVAGIMGGKDSEVTTGTRDLFIEVASFDPKRTRAARRALAMTTDASYRFERGVDPELAPVAMDRVARLILLLAGGTLADAPLDIAAQSSGGSEVTLRFARLTQILGAELTPESAKGYLAGAGFEVLAHGARELRVRVPSWRGDVAGEADLVEEVARFHGYDRFPAEIRAYRPTTTRDDPMWALADRLRQALVGLGMFEARPMPFVRGVDASHVRVGNPLSEDEAFLRAELCETLGRRAEHNLAHRVGDVRLFEIGSVFARGEGAMPSEHLNLGVLLMGRRHPPHFSEPQPPFVDEWDAKAVAEVAARVAFPGQPVSLVGGSGSALWIIRVGEEEVGHVSRLALDAPVWAGPAFGVEITLAVIATAAEAPPGQHNYMVGAAPGAGGVPKYKPLPTMPAAEFDLALLVPKPVTVADVERVIRSAAGEWLERLELFDQYSGAGVDPDHRSLAWRLTFRHPERTLRDKEIDGRRGKILGALGEELHVRQRTA